MCDTSLERVCFVHFLSDVSHTIVQCVTRHSNHVRHVTRQTFLEHFLSDVSHMIVQCVTRHSGSVMLFVDYD
jgi:hypothetical protein